MSTRDLTTLADHADSMLTNTDTPPAERDLWRSIGREVRAHLGRDDEPPIQEALFADPIPDTIRVLIAPCGCMCAADVTGEPVGFCRSVAEKRQDDADGYTERRIPMAEYRRTPMGCDHEPKWGVAS